MPTPQTTEEMREEWLSWYHKPEREDRSDQAIADFWLNIVRQAQLDVVAEVEDLIEYVEHSDRCIISYLEAGEPTENGGYRQKFRGVWYQAKPIDETPKCDCGLSDLLATLSALKERITATNK